MIWKGLPHILAVNWLTGFESGRAISFDHVLSSGKRNGMSRTEEARDWFRGFQEQLLLDLEKEDPQACRETDEWERPEGGGGRSCALTAGGLIEKGGVNFSHVYGRRLPASATERRPALADRSFEAMGVSVVLHPDNPHVPAAHMNVRFFRTTEDHEAPPLWWFGGGFDLTPVYPYFEDAVEWHRAAERTCRPFGDHLYPRLKEACDRYFHLPHRGECRGVGGLFFDDFDELGEERSFAFTKAVGEAFLPAWVDIARRRRHTSYGKEEKEFQLYRRGRYVEFNLLYDRGTRFGLQSGGRTESILMSMPPMAKWAYGGPTHPGAEEARLHDEFLQPRNWLAEADEKAAL